MNLKLVLIKELMEGVLSNMNKNEDLVVNYYDPKEENDRINQSIISEVKRKTLKEGIEQGIKQGIQRGISENQKEIVWNMYNKNYKTEDISEITNLSVLQVKEIIDNHNQIQN